MRGLKNLEAHELIGLECKVMDSTNELQVGIRGKVMDETKNMLVVNTPKGKKMIQKKGAKFMFKLGESSKLIVGDKINYRSYERTKKVIWRRRK